MSGVDDVVSACPFGVNPAIARASMEVGGVVLRPDGGCRKHPGRPPDRPRGGRRPGLHPAVRPGPGLRLDRRTSPGPRFDRLDEVRLRVGALPQFPTGALKYNLTWSTDGLINEYCNPCEVIREGRRDRGPAAGGARAFLARRGRLRGVQHLGRPRHTVGDPRRAGPQPRLQDRPLSRAPRPRSLAGPRAAARERRDHLKDILETAVPDHAAGRRVDLLHGHRVAGRPVHPDQRRPQDLPRRASAATWSAIQITTASGHLRGAGHAPRRQARPAAASCARSRSRSTDFLANRFGAVYDQPGRIRPMPWCARLIYRSDVPETRGVRQDQPGVAAGERIVGRRALRGPFADRRRSSWRRSWRGQRGRRAAGRRGQRQAFLALAGRPGAPPGRAGPADRRDCARAARSELAALVTLEVGKIRSEALGEVQEMDRHLRLRRRPVAAASRPDDRQRAARPPDDGAVAPARAGRGDHAPSTSRSPSGPGTRCSPLVCGDPVVWKPSEKAPLLRPGRPWHLRCRPRRDAARLRPAFWPSWSRRSRGRRGDGRVTRGSPLVSATGSVADGPGRRRGGRGRLGRSSARTGRQQRPDRRPERPIWSWPCGRSSSRPPGPPASAARRLRRLIVHEVAL